MKVDISLLSVVGKMYSEALTDGLVECSEMVNSEDQCVFREGRSYLDQIFVVRQLCKKNREMKKWFILRLLN